MGWVENVSDEVDRISEWRTIVIVCTVLSFCSFAIVCSRLWIRQKNHGLAGDDWMSILSMFFALLYSILCIVRTFNRDQPFTHHAAFDANSSLFS